MAVLLQWRGCAAMVVLAGGAAVCQTPAASGWFVSGAAAGTQAFVAPAGSARRPVTGLPYSGERVTESVQTLADGTHITQTTQTIMMYRDSAGRTRTEHMVTTPSGVAIPGMVRIADPVAGCEYILEEQSHAARRIAGVSFTPYPVAKTGPAVAPVSKPGAPMPEQEMKQESLGTKTIEGLNAEGTRVTVTFPAGSIGNDGPITTVTETWMSPELKIMLLFKSSDPRTGESTTKLVNVSRAEPDAALFQVPADYTLEDAQQPAIRR